MLTSRALRRWTSVVAGVVGLVCTVPMPASAGGGGGGSIPRLGRRVPAVGGDISDVITTTCGNSPIVILSVIVCQWELPETAFLADINRLRASRGLPALKVRADLTRKARRWAATMASARRIRHSRLRSGVTANWHKLGENVGMGSSQRLLHAAFVDSPGHFAHLVDPAFEYVGIGVVAANGLLFVSEVFMQPAHRRGAAR